MLQGLFLVICRAADLLERAGHLLKRRKPNLYVHISVESPLWCIAGEQGSKNEMMQIMFSADFNPIPQH